MEVLEGTGKSAKSLHVLNACQVTFWMLFICGLINTHSHQVSEVSPYKPERLSICPKSHNSPILLTLPSPKHRVGKELFCEQREEVLLPTHNREPKECALWEETALVGRHISQ